MAFCLKPGQETFEIVDGPFVGKKFEKGVIYETIPEHEAGKFIAAADVIIPVIKATNILKSHSLSEPEINPK
jgi:hypothetical protein